MNMISADGNETNLAKPYVSPIAARSDQNAATTPHTNSKNTLHLMVNRYLIGKMPPSFIER